MRNYLLLLLFVIASLMPISQTELYAQDPSNDNVTLVVSGEGTTKDEATKNALRSAIEQAFGTFVSANTKVLNDELIKDEIVTVTTGNIQNYKEVNYIDGNGTKIISLQVTVSVGKLVSYAQNKGMQTELAGATFVYNKKMIELNRRNEYIALTEVLPEQLDAISQKGLFDYSIVVSEPRNSTEKSGYNLINIKIIASFNENGKLFINTINNMMSSLSLTNEEKERFRKINEKYKDYLVTCFSSSKGEEQEMKFTLRNNYGDHEPDYGGTYIELIPLSYLFTRSLFSFQIEDNLGNKLSPLFLENKNYKRNANEKKSVENRQEFLSSLPANTNVYEGRSSWFISNYKGKLREFFSLFPLNEVTRNYWDFGHFFFRNMDGSPYFRSMEFKRGTEKLHVVNHFADAFDYCSHYEFNFIAYYSDAELSNLRAINVLPNNETIQEVEEPRIFETYKGKPQLPRLTTESGKQQMCDKKLSTFDWFVPKDHPYVIFSTQSKSVMSYLAIYNGLFVLEPEYHKEHARIKDYEICYVNQATKEERLLSSGTLEDTPYAQFIDLKDCEIDPEKREIIVIKVLSIYKGVKYNAFAITDAIGYGRQL